MNCKEFEKLIPNFLDETLEYEQMEDFQQHMAECNNCKEELSIQFLVREGMKHLENGDAFDLDGEFNRRIDKSRRSHARHKAIIRVYQWVVTTVLFMLGVVAIFLFG